MDRFRWIQVTRRAFLGALAGAASATVAACSAWRSDQETELNGEQLEPSPTPELDSQSTATAVTRDPTPTPEPTPTPDIRQSVSIHIAESIDESGSHLASNIAERLRIELEQFDVDLEQTSDVDSADVVVTAISGENEDGLARGEALIPVTAGDLSLPELTMDQLDELLSGSVSNWAEVGGMDRPVLPIETGRAIAAINEARSRNEVLLASTGSNGIEPGILALIPRSRLGLDLQVPIIDGTDPMRDELRPENWPYWQQIFIDIRDALDPDIRDTIERLLDVINSEATARRRSMMTCVGDVMLGRTIHTIMNQRGNYTAPFHLVQDELQRGDLVIGNLECVLTDSFAPPEDPMTFSLMTFPQSVEGLQFAGFDALSVANNHAMDFGITGLRDTKQTLSDAGIASFGGGDNLEQARRPAFLEHEGVRFALLGYDAISMSYAAATESSGGIAPLIEEYVRDDISRARQEADVVIPFFHWGTEYVLTPLERDRRMARAAIDAGADLVLGGHPHWVQGMEIYQNKPIFYSLANFVFDQEWSLETKQSIILRLTFEGATLIGYRIVPALIEEFHRPRIVEDEMRDIILERFWRSTRIIEETPLA